MAGKVQARGIARGVAWCAALCALLVAALAAGMLTAPAQAHAQELGAASRVGDTFTVGGNKYKITDMEYDDEDDDEAGEVTLVKYGSTKKSATVNTVKYKGMTFEVNAIGKKAFSNAQGRKVTSLTIGRNVDYIRSQAFSGCKKLKKIDMTRSDVIDIDKSKKRGYYIDDVDAASDAFVNAGAAGIKVKCGNGNTTYKKLFKKALKSAGMRNDVKVVK